MKKKVMTLVILGLLLLSFLTGQSQAEQQQKLRLVTTIFPLTELVRAVSVDRAEILQLIPTSAEVHTFQLRPSDLKTLAEADLLICVGGHLEPWLGKVEKSLNNKKLKTIRFFDYLSTVNYPGLKPEDPHLWLDFQADCLLVEKIVEELTILDPPGAVMYKKRGQELLNELKSIDEEYQKTIACCQQKDLIIAGHQAFGYLATRYGLQQVALTGPNPEAQPSPRKLQEIINLIKTRQLKAIFYESSTPPAYAQTIARETGVKLYGLSTGVNLTRSEIEKKIGFLELMKRNLETLKKGLVCK